MRQVTLTIGTALILIGEVGAPACVAGAEAQLGDGVTKEEYEGSTSRHSACLLRTCQDAAKGRYWGPKLCRECRSQVILALTS